MGLRRIALAFALLAVGSADGHAMEPEAVFGRYSDYLSRMGLTARHGGFEVESQSTVRFKEVDLQGGRDGKPIRVEWLKISDFEVDPQGAFVAGAIETGPATGESTDKDGNKFDFRIEGVKATGVYLPPAEMPGAPSVSKTVPFAMEVGTVSATLDGVQTFSISGIKASAAYGQDGATIETETDLGEMNVNIEPLGPKAREQIDALGLSSLLFKSRARMTWNPVSGKFDVPEYRLEAPGAGALTVALSLEGYTSELAGRMQKLAQKGTEQGDASPEAQMALAGQQMALMGGVKLASFAISFEDGSLTGKLLQKQAEAMGMTPEELIETVPALVQPYLAMTGDPAFSDQAVGALQTFLKSPRNLAIAIAPNAPQAITELVGAALGDPASAIGMLGATVTANR